MPDNARARSLYEGIGFETERIVALRVVTRT